jgi:hypothetical protein
MRSRSRTDPHARKRRGSAIRTTLAATIAAAIAMAGIGVPAGALLGAGASTQGVCPKVILYFSRGSGQPLDLGEAGGDARGLATPGLKLYEALAARYGAANVGSIANAYPAVPISWRLIHTSRVYPPSVAAGERSLKRNLTDLVGLCPVSKLVLAGFSQGAEVTHAALAEVGQAEQRQIAAVLLFGDPLFAANEANIRPEASREPALNYNRKRKGIRYYMLVRAKPLAASWSGKVFSW